MKKFFQKIFAIKRENTHKIINILGFKIKINSPQNNKIYVIRDGKKFPVKKIKGLKIKLRGKNNTIIVEEPYRFENSQISIKGENNTVSFQSTKYKILNLTINQCISFNNRKINIGKDFSCIKVQIDSWGDDTTIDIGNDCQFSKNIYIRSSDGHKIFNKNNLEDPINKSWGCSIGNHVWCGQSVHIGKNVRIADNTIIGEASIVTKSFNEEFTAIAGNPAKIIKKELSWSRDNY